MSVAISGLKAPFPWFGGKRRVAHIVWERFGNVPNYVEPFAGSLAVLLGRPAEWPAKNETVNDLDCFVANFWRAIAEDPESVAHHADWPVNEADLHARHQWLHSQDEFIKRMHGVPDAFDVRIAGWWVWGISAWIGDNWCRVNPQNAQPDSIDKGVHTFRGDGSGLDARRPHLGGNGVHAKRPMLKKGGVGVHAQRSTGDLSPQIPSISAPGRGVHAKYARTDLQDYMIRLSERLRRVRVCCGDWARILGPSPTIKIGVTAVMLDPPYGVEDRDKVYNHDCTDLAGNVRQWCLENGSVKRLRIALCGYAGEHNALEAEGWDVVAWKAAGGYGARRKDNKNADRERIWFSPGCLQPEPGLFD